MTQHYVARLLHGSVLICLEQKVVIFDDADLWASNSSPIHPQGNRYIKKGGKLFPCPSSVNTSTFFDLAPDEEVVTVIHKLCARIVLEYDFSFVTKSGFGLRPAEAEAMRLVSKYTSVAVPQIYHTNFSCEDDGFIEMSLVQGSPLEGKWDTMDAKRKESICRQTWDLISKIGYVPSQYEGKFQCVADGSPSKDPLLEDLQSLPRAITSDSDLGARIYERYLHFGGTRYEHELPDMLPRSDRAVFTHGDIAHRNIMVDENGNVTGIIDWKYAGWYPDYWEYAQILRPAFWGDWSI
ncbi:kinase-like protein [Aspergillus sergii]|uniref:Kinase-like protein n=1 Tax=Aspergillus sergii TaxID=1034303 RepID=A0A5N6WRN2_9EURO|nr:kinase-like protein [Aspergillus sergii]